MPPRHRKPENADLEPNVYTNKVGDRIYYYYENPVTKERAQLGTKKEEANAAAREVNGYLGGAKRTPTVKLPIARIVKEWLPKRLHRLGSAHSKKRATRLLGKFSERFGRNGIRDIDTRDINEWIKQEPASNQAKARIEAIKLFDYALSQGYLPHNYGNPAKVTEYTPPPPAERMRLGYADYKQIHDEAEPWLQIGMELMLHTTMRPDNIVNLRFDQVQDGAIHTQIKKSGRFLRIELDEYEQGIVKRSRASGIASPYIVHRMPQRKGKTVRSRYKDHPTQLTVDQFSREFRKIRDRLGICGDVETGKRPSLYEIRSLGLFLYGEQGRDDAQQLADHTSEKMTAYYQYERRVVYTTVRAGLKL